jgi:hypothetical protein
MTFLYLLKKIAGKWITMIAKNNLAQTLVMQEYPAIDLSMLPLKKSTKQKAYCTKD